MNATLEKPLDATSRCHPVKQIVTSLPAGGRVTRKYDGIFYPRELGGCLLLGELVRPKSGGLFTAEDRELLSTHGEFWAAFDIVRDARGEIGHLPASQRIAALHALTPDLARSELKSVLAEQILEESPESVIARGGEGVCWQDWNSGYGSMLVIKRGEIHLCRVTKTGGTQSVGICDAQTGQDRGNVKMGGGACDQLRVGSIVRIEAMSITEKGLFRQATKCRNWLISY